MRPYDPVPFNVLLTHRRLTNQIMLTGIPLRKVERIFPLKEGHIVEQTDRKVKNGFQLESKVCSPFPRRVDGSVQLHSAFDAEDIVAIMSLTASERGMML